MANRATLHFSHTTAFKKWMVTQDYVLIASRGQFEAMRFAHPTKEPVIVYAKLGASQHYSVQDKDWSLVRRFLKSLDAPKPVASIVERVMQDPTREYPPRRRHK